MTEGERKRRSAARTLSVKRVRRTAAALIAVAGALDLVSALTPPIRDRIHPLMDLIPLAVPQTATALVALSGLGLILLSRGIRHGQKNAWRLGVLLLGGSVILHLVKGVDLEEALVAAIAFGYLGYHRDGFQAPSDMPSGKFAALAVGLGGGGAVIVGTVVVEVFRGGEPRLALGAAVLAVAERLVGVTSIHLHDRLDDFISPALGALGAGVIAMAGWLLFRPVVNRLVTHGDSVDAARLIVQRYGRDTLAYFALRDDKQHFFYGESLVAYAVITGTCLVSPDPIGPPFERAEVWAAFRQYVDKNGWSIAVLGASEDWLTVYRAAGMHDLYVGDEGVVNIPRFNLQGGKSKGLRQAVNRIARNGYTVKFFDPSKLPPSIEAQLRDVMTRSRRGSVERGFSMTLGRAFEPYDTDLLLAVAFDSDNIPVAFCQYVPAAGINGYSLDLMRRDNGEHPNGLVDFIIVQTVEHLRERGMTGLALNFATMRAVMAGEKGTGWWPRLQKWVLGKMSGSMQIESLRHFNGKFDPDWHPRYAVYDGPEHVLPVALAVAKAESFWELPVIGRFLVRGPSVPAARR